MNKILCLGGPLNGQKIDCIDPVFSYSDPSIDLHELTLEQQEEIIVKNSIYKLCNIELPYGNKLTLYVLNGDSELTNKHLNEFYKF